MKKVMHITILSVILLGAFVSPLQAEENNPRLTTADLGVRAAWHAMWLYMAISGFSDIGKFQAAADKSSDDGVKLLCADAISSKKWWGCLQLLYSGAGLYYTYVDYQRNKKADAWLKEQSQEQENVQENPQEEEKVALT